MKHRRTCAEEENDVCFAFGVTHIGIFLRHLFLKPISRLLAEACQENTYGVFSDDGEGYPAGWAALGESRDRKQEERDGVAHDAVDSTPTHAFLGMAQRGN